MEKTKIRSIWDNYRLPVSLIVAIVIGSLIGIFFGDFAKTLSPFGDIFINLMFVIVVPLVFLSVSSAVSSIGNLKRLGKILKNLALVFIVTGFIASVIMIIMVKAFPPAEGVNIPLEAGEGEAVNIGEAIVNAFTVPDFSLLLSRNSMLALIVFAIFFGICTVKSDKDGKISAILEKLCNVFMVMVKYIMWYAPIGLGCYFANLVATYGPELLGSYAKSMAVYYPLCIVYFFLGFLVYAYWSTGSKDGPRLFFGNIFNSAITSLATCSSIATIPCNLATTKKIGVPKDISEIVVPIGATAHMDGTCFSSILKIAFLFGVFGRDFSGLDTYAIAMLIAVMAGVIMSGIPGGGLIGEMLICSIYGFPPEAFPIIATIGFLVDPPATMLNATGDSLASMMVARLIDGKDWWKKEKAGEL